MVYPQIFNVLEGHLDSGPAGFDGPDLDDDLLLMNSEFMTDMQQQQQQQQPEVANNDGFGSSLDIGGLDNVNPNILMNTFQTTPPPQQQQQQQQQQTNIEQQGRDIQAMSVQDVADAFTAVVGNGGNSNSNGSSHNSILPDPDLFGNNRPDTTGSATSPPTYNNNAQVQQSNAFGGELFGGLGQLQNGSNTLQQQTMTTNQPTATNGNGFQSQQTLANLQQQLASLQHQAQQQLIQHPNQEHTQQRIQSLLVEYKMNNHPNLNPRPLPFPAWGDFKEGNNNVNNNNSSVFQQGLSGQKMPPQQGGKLQKPVDNNSCLLPVDKNDNFVDATHVVGALGGGNVTGIFDPDSMPTSPGENSSSTDSPQRGPSQQQQSKTTKQRRTRAQTFPEKLMLAMLKYTDETAVAWLPDGKSFVIVNPDMFCEDVLKKVFKESKYSSFVRKLHRWGFIRLTSGTGTDCFHHPMFQKDHSELCSKIKCAPSPKNDKDKDRAAISPSLTGVEKFIRAKVLAAAARAEERSLRTSRSAEEAGAEEEEVDVSGGEDGH